MAERDTLDEGKEAFKLASEAEQEQRVRSLDDLRFGKLGEQWPEAVKKQRELEGRPCLTHNRMPSFMKQVVNDARQNRPAMKFHPVGSGATRECAEILDGLARNIEYTSNADVAYDTALDFSVASGIGYWLIRTDYAGDDTFDQDILIERVSNPFSIYGDPHSTAADSADWNNAFITDLLSKAEFKRRWPSAEAADFDARDQKDMLWFQGEQVQVAEWWRRDEVPGKILLLSNNAIMQEDEFLKMRDILALDQITVKGDRIIKTHRVRQFMMSGAEVLEENKWDGKYIPIVPVYGEEVNIEGKRYFQSLIHFAKDSQRQYNFWRTATTELVALAPKAPFIGAVGQFATDPKWGTANTASHPYLEYDPVPGMPPPMRQGFTGPPAGALQEALNASDDMKNIMGLHDASLGARSNETSGRAIMARQREGDVSTFNFIDNLSRGIRHSGRIIQNLIPQVYTGERIIRCIKEDGSNFSMPVNQPVIPAQPQASQQQMGQPQPQGQPMYQAAPPGAQEDPQLKGLIKVFDLSQGKYDVTVEAGPSFTTRREEAAVSMMEFIRVFPQAAPLIGDLLAKNLDWPGADEISKRLAAMLPPQVQGQNPQLAALQQQMQQMDGMAKQAVGELQKQLAEMAQQVANKQREEEIKQYDAQTKRMSEVADAAAQGLAIVPHPELGFVAMPIQPATGEPVPPTPEQLMEHDLKMRDLNLRDRELAMRERESLSQTNAQDVAAQAQRFAEIELPESRLQQQQQAMHDSLMNALGEVVQRLAQKPTRRQARAVRQPDGSYKLEAIDTPIDVDLAPPPEVVQ